ncbi:chemotaxis protein CheW [Xylanivirga thermophila]|jgi:purine-binding chemotaxis protein CheW|uniref:chemotaxis protein CheW n=1 Tax=Xylanivirga thermophila TaxID=2496273 RepID=UPI00101CE765|nr:chemotaxis protein CheW [Xylanivirga thermophila]
MGTFIIFYIDDKIYALNVLNVQSIERMADITRVPYSTSYILGVINLRGEIIPVMSLRKRLKMDSKEYDDDTRIIIAQHEEHKIGIIVDGVREVLDIPDDIIQPASDVLENYDGTFIDGVIKQQDKLFFKLNTKSLLGVK